MTTTANTRGRSAPRLLLNKVPEVTLWFWVIKILCTTVGESFADYINMTLGVGLVPTAVIFTIAFVAVLGLQMRLRTYVPAAYWLTVVVVSVTGTLYTDILTDQVGVPLWISTTVFASMLAGVFGLWYARERTLSIHSIVTTPREAFYWLAVLVTFALGTATGDWTLELTGWGPGQSVLLPLGLIVLLIGLWRFGANPVLTFWLVYILTRPLGANIGDWLATPADEQGLGLGTFGTSVVFLLAILVAVAYLSITKADVIDGATRPEIPDHATPSGDLTRERASLVAIAGLAVGTGLLLTYANNQPHISALDEEATTPSCSGDPASLSATEAHDHVQAAFSGDDVDQFRTLAQDTLGMVETGQVAEAKSRVTDLESAWDDAQSRLVSKDCVTWAYVDGEVDSALTAVRAPHPDPSTESGTLTTLITTLR
ncbi:hypothetical protein [Nocardioides sp. Root151]|uniref:COG4705 family protein n=1 Tax=Nocardioides sp. Root151 TaxID=1736475 RepID=UPI000702A09A|nr:hypothetical protein [Nocardioides sp. Root151]KQZ70783.1 hypothetical protein ASD66_14545 [Nocardioides sp. Root151]